jgi:Ca2+-binding EF-hand superfamily protein
LVKYDLNHNGVIDPDEKKAALTDPAFIESELDAIDTNHNYRIDPEELAYFDANHDKILEPAEQTGIEIAQHLLAQKLFKKLDVDGDGQITPAQFKEWLLNTEPPGTIPPRDTFRFMGGSPDINHDGIIDPSELEAWLKQQTLRKLRPMNAVALYSQQHPGEFTPDESAMFKFLVENYWRNPHSLTSPYGFHYPQGMGVTPGHVPGFPPGFVIPPGFHPHTNTAAANPTP